VEPARWRPVARPVQAVGELLVVAQLIRVVRLGFRVGLVAPPERQDASEGCRERSARCACVNASNEDEDIFRTLPLGLVVAGLFKVERLIFRSCRQRIHAGLRSAHFLILQGPKLFSFRL
jgi:hypothetical protein